MRWGRGEDRSLVWVVELEATPGHPSGNVHMPERKQGPGRWNTEPQPQGHPHSGRPGAERKG